MNVSSKELTIAEMMFTLRNGLRFQAHIVEDFTGAKRPLGDIVKQTGHGEESFNQALRIIKGEVQGTLTAALHDATSFMRDLSFEGHTNATTQYVSQFEQALRESSYIN